MAGTDMYDIFISYRTTSYNWVRILAQNIKTQNYSVFLDRWELIPGQNFPAKIHEALNNARCGILVATPDSSESGWVQQELQQMITLKNSGSGFFFIPVVMGCFPDLPFVENVQAVDFEDSRPEVYRRAFQRLLCGIKQIPPGQDASFKGNLVFPERSRAGDRPLVKSENSFLASVFNKLQIGRPLMILAQADNSTQHYARALRKRAENIYGNENVYHIFPPNSTRADSATYFGRLAKQCHFEGEVSESWHWADSMTDKLDGGQDVFLLITGFENGPDESRAEFAGELRQLKERYPALRFIMMGGERLAALKNAHGSMSLLNIAEELPIPELDSRDLPQIFGHIYPQLALTQEQLQEVIKFTGCHPRLLHHCLQEGANSARECEHLLRQSPLPAQLFTHFQSKRNRTLLCGYLRQTKLEKYDPWPSNELLRKLYWSNLITRQGSYFCWRSEFINQVGQEMIECS